LVDLLDPVKGAGEFVLVLFAGRGHQLRRREERENGRERHQHVVHGYRGGGEPGEVELHIGEVQIAVGVRERRRGRVSGDADRGDREVPQRIEAGEARRQRAA
jgi:hypothetical protein